MDGNIRANLQASSLDETRPLHAGTGNNGKNHKEHRATARNVEWEKGRIAILSDRTGVLLKKFRHS
jgi:hypothetical protein